MASWLAGELRFLRGWSAPSFFCEACLTTHHQRRSVMYRKLLVGMGVVLGLLTGATVGQAQGPQFSQVTIIGATNVMATGNNTGTFNGKTASSPAFFQGFHYPGGPHLQFNNYTPNVIYPFTVKIVNSGPTFQQVFLTSKG